MYKFVMLDKDKEASFIVKLYDGDRQTINFHLGQYETENENIVKGLRGSFEYGKRFIEQGDFYIPVQEPAKATPVKEKIPEYYEHIIEVKPNKGKNHGKFSAKKTFVR